MSTNSVAIVGAAAIPVGKWQTRASEPVQVLEHEVLAQVVLEAVAAAGVDKEDIGTLSFAQPRPYTAQKYFATFMANFLRLTASGSVIEVLGNGMTGAWAFEQARKDLQLGNAKVALALGVNFETAVPTTEHGMNTLRAVGDVDFQGPFGITPIAWYGMAASRYLNDFGVTREQLAAVAVKNRGHAALNPLAQFRSPITVTDVVNQRSIVEPLGLLDVPARGDGAVCVVLATEEVARSLGRPYVRIRGAGFHHEGVHQISDIPDDITTFGAATIAAAAAFKEAGVSAADLDLAELYAPCTIVEVIVSEALGLAKRGRGAIDAAMGDTAIGGRIPISTSGGLMSRGHPSYVTPLYGMLELFQQLTGVADARQVENAALALSTAELGIYNAAMVHILEGVR
ncbi:MAG TPA: thiolase family protein [Terrimesophilobacter sp.]|nr:thiolase family protein [Terrimesophilobacter sp.]HRP98829.1 thiolase family protein [Terrimesophilobacter sp.]